MTLSQRTSQRYASSLRSKDAGVDYQLRTKIAAPRMTFSVAMYCTSRSSACSLVTFSPTPSTRLPVVKSKTPLPLDFSTALHQCLRNKKVLNPSIPLRALCDFAVDLDTIYHYRPDAGHRSSSTSNGDAHYTALLAQNRSQQASTAMEIDTLAISMNA
ncbi:hypothetical protein DFQ27_000190 [Actinomortierella ambigua]|uniref:Uncharacterized protein n=1 Tax=Actinomortierella ambigua TaxID=1343610 RepID=A0A9P6U969_9FUNG|nr:hypothetical protein DFQ27_000190 [Actinomortierella ambigua]